jgi:hypothetical protein
MIDNLIFYIHVGLIIIGILIPFFGNQNLLEMYSLLIPFLFYHWAVNNDTCALTILEQYFTETPKEKTFMQRLIGPVYNIPNDQIGQLTKTIWFLLWLVVQYRLGHLDHLKRTLASFFSKNRLQTLKR